MLAPALAAAVLLLLFCCCCYCCCCCWLCACLHAIYQHPILHPKSTNSIDSKLGNWSPQVLAKSSTLKESEATGGPTLLPDGQRQCTEAGVYSSQAAAEAAVRLCSHSNLLLPSVTAHNTWLLLIQCSA
jgi:hypothetical protein